MASTTGNQSPPDVTNTSSAIILYNPSQYQNRNLLPIPNGWTSKSRTLTTFTCFPQLPLELRQQIYNVVLLQPRILTLTSEIDGNQVYEYCRGMPGWKWDVHCSVRNPPLLFTCTESRTEALRKYQILDLKGREYRSKFSWGQFTFKRPVYFNKECDIFAFEDADLLKQMALEGFAGVKSLGLCFYLSIFSQRHFATNWISIAKCFKGVGEEDASIEELVIVLPEPRPEGKWSEQLRDRKMVRMVRMARQCMAKCEENLGRVLPFKILDVRELGTDGSW